MYILFPKLLNGIWRNFKLGTYTYVIPCDLSSVISLLTDENHKSKCPAHHHNRNFWLQEFNQGRLTSKVSDYGSECVENLGEHIL